jgi:hypothetical protein
MNMKKSILKLWLPGLLVAAIAGMPLQLRAQDTNKAPTEKKEARSKKSGAPFHGKLKAVDNTAKSISVGNLVIQTTSETKITKAGKRATLADGAEGEEVSGSYRKTDEGKLNAVTIHFGPKDSKSQSKKDEAGNEK